MFRPGFRESAFQPFNKGEEEEEEEEERNLNIQQNPAEMDAEDSEGDEVVDIERIEDREEDRDKVQVDEVQGSRTEERERQRYIHN